MKYRFAIAALSMMVLAAPFAIAATPAIQGNYIEVRSCDVYTGPCFAMGERGLAGREAILTWDVVTGSHDGVALDGLKVIGVVRATETLTGDHSQTPFSAKSVIIVDRRANEAQAAALISLAKEMGGELLNDVVRVEVSEIFVKANECSSDGCAFVRAEGLVDISTRCLHEGDKVCLNESNFYPPLTKVDSAVAHFAVENDFQGEGLGVKWIGGDNRGAYMGTFSR